MKRPRIMLRAVTGGILSCIMLFSQPVSALTTQEKIRQAEELKKATEAQLDHTGDKLENLEGGKQQLESYLGELNGTLSEISNNLADLEEQLQEKEEEIEITRQNLEDARERQEKQYELMKRRMRYVYEKGDVSVLETFFTATDYADFLNRAHYVTRINEYDKRMLEKYIETKEEIEEEEQELLKEQEQLEEIEEEVTAQKNKVSGLVSSTSGNINTFKGQIAAAEQEKLAYEESIKQQEANLEALRKKLAEEQAMAKKARAAYKRDISTVVFAEGDLELLAALIECEAGGESYDGKIAVGAVVINRLLSSVYPDSMVGVIYQNRQFSPVASGRLAAVLARGANATCRQAAQEAMSGVSNVGDCYYFRTVIPEINGIIIGNHVFY